MLLAIEMVRVVTGRRRGAAAIALWAGLTASAALAQPVVQSIARSAPETGGEPGASGLQSPSNESMNLNAALARLGRNPRDGDALIDAGHAALTIGDVDAAIGFFRRAEQVTPGNSRVKAGLARSLVRSGNPYDAIPLFEDAERAGTLDSATSLDRGLAYDLVADNATAQRYYRQALAIGPNEEATRRLAISLSIAGDKRATAAVLSPLLLRQDKASWRARAFTLAIMGQTEEAITVVNGTLPAGLAAGIAPYLRYMPRLTPAQQAAAANFGQFPRASEIGRDDPRVALYSSATARRPALASADAGLIPKGEPLGRNARDRSSDRSRNRDRDRDRDRDRGAERSRAENARHSPPEVAIVDPPLPPRVATVARPAAPQTAAPQTTMPQSVMLAPRSAVAVAASPPPALRPPVTATSPVATPAAPPRPAAGVPAAPLPAPAPVRVAALTPPPAPQVLAPVRPLPPAPLPPAPTPTRAPLAVASNPPPPTPPTPPAPVPAAPSPPPAARPSVAATAAAPPVPPTPRRQSLAEAFSDLGRPTADATPASGAVDIRRIRPTRQPATGAAAATTAPAVPSHPSRIWVQLATGRDKRALGFDFRRIAREAEAAFKSRRPFVSVWGQSNRLLTGPFDTEAAANAFLTQLRRADVDGAFIWTSPAGQVVDSLAVR